VREAVNDVIEERAHDPRGLNRTMTASFAIHVGMVLLFGVVLRGWLSAPKTPPPMMTITLGVSPGPKSTGMTAIGGRQVDQVEPPPKKPEPVKPKSEVAMNVPPPAKPESSKPAQAAPPPPAAKPTTGPEIRKGTALVETGAKGQGVGLTFGGGAGAPSLQLAPDFCCPVYADQILSIISRNWQRVQPEKGQTVVIFTIHRDGSVTGIAVDIRSGSFLLDQKSIAAVPKQLLALPSEYKESTLTVHLTFPYGGS
jgi:outer membrane biosynthesis protein TonB